MNALTLSPKRASQAEWLGGACITLGTVITVAAEPLAGQLETRVIHLIEPGLALATFGLVLAIAANHFRADLEG